MRKLLFPMLLTALILCGCSTSPSVSSSSSASAPEASAVSSQSSQDATKLTDDQKQEIASYLQSDEKVALDSALDEAMDNITDLVESGDASEIDRRFVVVSKAVSDAESVDVPVICENLNYNIIQAGRATSIALSCYSDAISGSTIDSSKIEEGSEYSKQATDFITAYSDELKRLTEMAK